MAEKAQGVQSFFNRWLWIWKNNSQGILLKEKMCELCSYSDLLGLCMLLWQRTRFCGGSRIWDYNQSCKGTVQHRDTYTVLMYKQNNINSSLVHGRQNAKSWEEGALCYSAPFSAHFERFTESEGQCACVQRVDGCRCVCVSSLLKTFPSLLPI